VGSGGGITTKKGGSTNEEGGDLTIVAGAIDIQSGSTGIDAAGTVSISGGGEGSILRIGQGATDSPGALALSSEELSRIKTGAGMNLGGAGTARLEITGGLTKEATAGISGTVRLVAGQNAGRIVFSGGPAEFRALAAEAHGGLEVWSDVTTTEGDIALDGNTDGSFFNRRMSSLLAQDATEIKKELSQIEGKMAQPEADRVALLGEAKSLSRRLVMSEMGLRDIGGDTMRKVARRATDEAQLAHDQLAASDTMARRDERELLDAEAPLRVEDTYLRGVVQASLAGISNGEKMVAETAADLATAREVMLMRSLRRQVEGTTNKTEEETHVLAESPAAMSSANWGDPWTNRIWHMAAVSCTWEDTFRRHVAAKDELALSESQLAASRSQVNYSEIRVSDVVAQRETKKEAYTTKRDELETHCNEMETRKEAAMQQLRESLSMKQIFTQVRVRQLRRAADGAGLLAAPVPDNTTCWHCWSRRYRFKDESDEAELALVALQRHEEGVKQGAAPSEAMAAGFEANLRRSVYAGVRKLSKLRAYRTETEETQGRAESAVRMRELALQTAKLQTPDIERESQRTAMQLHRANMTFMKHNDSYTNATANRSASDLAYNVSKAAAKKALADMAIGLWEGRPRTSRALLQSHKEASLSRSVAVVKIEKLKAFIAQQQGNADLILASQNKSKTLEQQLQLAQVAKDTSLQVLTKATVIVQNANKSLEAKAKEAERTKLAAKDEPETAAETPDTSKEDSKNAELSRVSQELVTAVEQHAAAKGKAKEVAQECQKLKRRVNESGVTAEQVAAIKTELEGATQRKESALKNLYDLSVSKYKLSVAESRLRVELGVPEGETKPLTGMGPLRKTAELAKRAHVAAKKILEEATTEVDNARADADAKELALQKLESSHATEKKQEESFYTSRRMMEAHVIQVLADSRQAKREWLSLEEQAQRDVKLFRSLRDYAPKLTLIETRFNEVKEVAWKKHTKLMGVIRNVSKIEKGYNKTKRRLKSSQVEVFRNNLWLNTSVERQAIGVEKDVISVSEERYMLYRQCFSRHGRKRAEKRLRESQANSTRDARAALLKAEKEVHERTNNTKRMKTKFENANETIAGNQTESDSATEASDRVWRVLRAVRNMELNARSIDPPWVLLKDAIRDRYYKEKEWNSTTSLENYHMRVSAHYQDLQERAYSKYNRTFDLLRKAKSREISALEALSQAHEAWMHANRSLSSATRRFGASDYHHDSLVPTITIGHGVTVSAKGGLSIGHHNDSGTIETAGEATLRARGGVTIADPISPGATSVNRLLTIDADYDEDGEGAVKIAPGAPLASSGGLHITASDVDLQDSIDVRGGSLHLAGSKRRQSITIGDMLAVANEEQEGELQLSGATLEWINAPRGAVVGNSRSGHIEVGKVKAWTSHKIGGILSLIAGQVGAQVRFDPQGSTFAALSAQAPSGIVLKGNTSTTSGDLELDGDLNTNTRGASITVASGIELTAAATLKLGKTGGARMDYSGKLSLKAATGCHVNVSAVSKGPKRRSPVTIEADTDKDGKGKFALGEGSNWNTNGNLFQVRASDVELAGGIDAGQAAVTIQPGKPGSTLAIGGVGEARPRFQQQLKTEKFFMMSSKEVDMHADMDEMSRVTAGGLTIGSSTTGNVIVESVTNETTDTMGRLTLVATARESTVTFTKESSFQNSLTVQAGGGLIVQRNLTTHNDEVRLRSGTGALNVNRKGAIDTSGEELFIESDQMVLNGPIVTGLGATTIDCYTPGTTLGLGYGQGTLQLQGEEFQRIHSTGLSMGGQVCGNVIVNDVQAHHSAQIGGIFTLAAVREDSHIIIGDAPSSFAALVVQADNGIFISGDLSTTSDEFGILTIDGDMREDERNNGTYTPTSYTAERKHRAVVFADGLTVTAKMTLSLGGVWEETRITWKARQAKEKKLDQDNNVTTEELTVVNQKVYQPVTIEREAGGDGSGPVVTKALRRSAPRDEIDYYGRNGAGSTSDDGDEEDEEQGGGTEPAPAVSHMEERVAPAPVMVHEDSPPPPPPPPPLKSEQQQQQQQQEEGEGEEGEEGSAASATPGTIPGVDFGPEGGTVTVEEEGGETREVVIEGSAATPSSVSSPETAVERVIREAGEDAAAAPAPPAGGSGSPGFGGPGGASIVGEYSLVGECPFPRMYRPRTYAPRPMCDTDGSPWWW